jgi:hypothetical protein
LTDVSVIALGQRCVETTTIEFHHKPPVEQLGERQK